MSDVNSNIEKTYSQLNIPFNELTTNIGDKIEIFGKLKPSCNSAINIINKLYKIVVNKDNKPLDCGEAGSLNLSQKTDFFNMYNILKIFNPLFFIILTILIITNCEPVWSIGESSVVQNIPSNITYVYLFLFFIVLIIVIYKFMKDMNKFTDVLKDIKMNKFKSFYVVIFLISIGFMVLINFILPSIISPIMDSITTLTDDQKSSYKKLIIYGLFIILGFLLFFFVSKYFRKNKLGTGTSGVDAQYFTMNNSIGLYLMLIFSLLFVTAVVTYIFGGFSSFFLNLLLGFIYFVYILIIYIVLYTVLQGRDYNKLLVFAVILLIIVSIAGFYLLNQTVNSINTLCETTGSTDETATNILMNVFIPIILFVLTIYLFGMKYGEGNWEANKVKFYSFYSIFTIIIVYSMFSSSLTVSGIYTFAWLVITIIQREWIWKLLKSMKNEAVVVGNGIKRGVENVEKVVVPDKLSNSLKVLDIDNANSFKSMNKSNMEKLVKKQYHKRSKINHPNKNTGSKEAFLKLGNAKEFVNKYIEKQ